MAQDRFGEKFLPLCLQVWEEVSREPAPEDFRAFALQALLDVAPLKSIVFFSGCGGHGTIFAQAGARVDPKALANEFLGDAADRETVVAADNWLAVGIRAHASEARVLAFHLANQGTNQAWTRTRYHQLAQLFGHSLHLVERQSSQTRRLAQLTVLLAQSTPRYVIESMMPSLNSACEKLYDAECAKIYLHDGDRQDLVVFSSIASGADSSNDAESQAIVRRVLQAKSARQNDGMAGSWTQVDSTRNASQSLASSALCVPISDSKAKAMGAIILRHARRGSFTPSDERDLNDLATLVGAILEQCGPWDKSSLKRATHGRPLRPLPELIGESEAVATIRRKIARLGPTDLAVLILGEHGTGKEIVSRSLHAASDRAAGPYLAINCAAITESLLESELFGHEKGAFTDAKEVRRGKFEVADGGTLFLDEIGELQPTAQAKLLRVLEEKTVTRVGGTEPIRTDVRVIAATNRDLAARVRENRFREDLFFRLNVATLQLPPLRERRDDILPLMHHFLQENSASTNRQAPTLSPEAAQRLHGYHWPGNIRQLRNLAQRLTFLVSGSQVEAGDLKLPDDENEHSAQQFTLTNATRQFQIAHIRQQIDAAKGSLTDAAERLGMHRSNLYRKMRQLGMPIDA